jgi:hypothetical protein
MPGIPYRSTEILPCDYQELIGFVISSIEDYSTFAGTSAAVYTGWIYTRD